jgi:hypothetical protein
MPCVGFEPTTPVFKQAKTVHALDRAATVIGFEMLRDVKADEKAKLYEGLSLFEEEALQPNSLTGGKFR